MKVGNGRRGASRRAGAALLFAVVVVVGMGGLCVALFGISMSTGRQRAQTRTAQYSFYAAEAGLSDAFMRVTEGQLEFGDDGTAMLGTAQEPLPLGQSAYWVEVRQRSSRSYALISTGIDGRYDRRLELVISQTPTGIFQHAAFGAEAVILDSNAFIDSYDSTLGSYASQVQGGNEYALQNGNVGSNKDVTLKSNTTVHGAARPGPGYTLDDSAPRTYVSGSTDPAEETVELPPIEIPSIPSAGNLVGTTDLVLGPGEIHYGSVLMMGGATLTIRGPATLVADDFKMKSNASLVFDASDGEIDVYAPGDFVLESNSNVTTLSDSALDVTLWLAGNNMTKRPADSLSLSANSEFIGAIYAPQARFLLQSNFNVYGSIMCGSLHLSSNGTIHFDEALLYGGEGATGDYGPVLWRWLPRQ